MLPRLASALPGVPAASLWAASAAAAAGPGGSRTAEAGWQVCESPAELMALSAALAPPCAVEEQCRLAAAFFRAKRDVGPLTPAASAARAAAAAEPLAPAAVPAGTGGATTSSLGGGSAAAATPGINPEARPFGSRLGMA